MKSTNQVRTKRSAKAETVQPAKPTRQNQMNVLGDFENTKNEVIALISTLEDRLVEYGERLMYYNALGKHDDIRDAGYSNWSYSMKMKLDKAFEDCWATCHPAKQ